MTRSEQRRRVMGWAAVGAAFVLVSLTWMIWPRSSDRAPSDTEKSAAFEVARSSGESRPLHRTEPASTAQTPTDEAPKTPDREIAGPTRFVVVEARGGVPIEGALLRFERSPYDDGPAWEALEATTGADGEAKFESALNTRFRVVARKRGFCIERKEIWRRGEVTRIELDAGIPVQGRVVYADTREPAAGVDVRAWLEDSDDPVEAEIDAAQQTDRDGRFELAGVPPSKWIRVYARRPGWGYVAATLARSEPGPAIEMVLGEGCVLEGTVYDEKGQPVPDVDVFSLWSWEDAPQASEPSGGTTIHYATRHWIDEFTKPPIRSDAAGRFTFRGLRFGPPRTIHYSAVAVLADGRQARSASVEFARSGERQTRDVQFAAAPVLTVRLKSPAPLEEPVVIRVEREHREIASRTLEPGETTAEFRDLPLGDWDVYASGADSEWTLREQVGIPDRVGEVVTFDLSDTARIEGTVVDDLGGVVADAPIRFTDRSGGIRFEAQTKSAKDGTFALRGLPREAGDLGVSAASSDLLPRRFDDIEPGGLPMRIVLPRRGRVTCRLDPMPAKNASISALYEGRASSTVISALDYSAGQFSISPGFVGGPLSAWISAEGFAPAFIDALVLPPGGSADLGVIRLDPGRLFDGILVREDGSPITHARLQPVEPWCEWNVEIDLQGRFRLGHLPPRPVHVRVSPPIRDRAFPEWLIVIEPGAKSGTFRIGTGCAVSGSVRDGKGAPVADRVVYFGPLREHAMGTWARTDDEGRWDIRLQPGRWRAFIHRGDGSEDGFVEFDAVAGESATIELRLK